jgi:hypothetical protein
MNQSDQYAEKLLFSEGTSPEKLLKVCHQCEGWLVLESGEWKHRWRQRPQWGEGCRYQEKELA